MRYDTQFEQDSLETVEELSDAFETGLRGDSMFETGAEELTDTETFGTELSDFEQEFDQEDETFGLGEGEEESEEEYGGRAPRGGGGNVQQKVQRQRLALAKLRAGVQAVGQHVRKEGGRLRFTLPARSVSDAATKLRVDPRMVSALLQSLRQTNMRAGRGGQRSELDTEMDETAMWQEVGRSCPGVTKFSTHWWGVSVWLNECHVKTLLEVADAGSGAAGICAALAPEGFSKTACAVAAGALKIGGFVIKRIDALGGNRGITIRKPWFAPPLVPPLVVWHQ